MDNKRPLVPGFLKKIDRWLLLSKPEAWSARTHLVFYYSFLTAVVITIIAFLVPDDPRTDSNSGAWAGLIIVVALLGLVFWLIYLLRFNVFKRFGSTGHLSRLTTFLLYFISIGILAALPFVQPRIETIRADMAYSEAEVVADVNEMNTAIAQIEYNRIDHEWRADSLFLLPGEPPVVSVDTLTSTTVTTTTTTTEVSDSGKGGVLLLNSEAMKERIRGADSLRKVNDSVYIIFNPPTYKFLDPYLYGVDEKGEYSSARIYKEVIRDHRADVPRLKKRTGEIIEKYRTYFPFYDNDNQDLATQIKREYSLNMVSTGMENIMERKQRWNETNFKLFFHLWFYSTLVVTLLVFTFRHSTAKTFFLSLLTAVVLLILSSVFRVFSGGGSAYDWILSYFLIFCIMSFFIFKNSSRSIWQGIALNMLVWLLPFIPTVVIAEFDDRRTRYVGGYEDYQSLFEIARWTGPFLLLLFLVTFIHAAYRKWYAAPDAQ